MILSVGLQAALGIAVAIVLERPGVRFGGLWRTLFILPWAIPEVAGAVAWRDVFHPQQGLLAQLLGHDVRWDQSPELSLVVLLIASTWMGWPLWMLVATAGLRTIPRAVSEAAALDGASPWRPVRVGHAAAAAAAARRGLRRPRRHGLQPVLPVLRAGAVRPHDDAVDLQLLRVRTPPAAPGLYSVSAAVNIVTLVALAIVVAWFLRRRSRAERVAFA